MAHIRHWPAGFGGTVGDAPLATAKDIYHYVDTQQSQVLFVDSATGDDANSGTRDAPFATFGQAVTTANILDVIVLFSGHAETITSAITISKKLIVIGEGSGTSRPTLTPNIASNGKLLNITAQCHFHGIIFAPHAQANTGNTIDCASASGSRFNYCEFQSDQYDDGIQLLMDPAASWVSNCVFKSNATSVANRPVRAFKDVRLMTDCTITGGTYGWTTTNTMQFGWGNSATGEVAIGAAANQASIIQCNITEGAYFDTDAAAAAADIQYTIWPEGLGLTGHRLISGKGLYILGADPQIYWVNSATGTDAAGYGLSAGKPFKTLAYATNTASAIGLVVVAGGHTETITAAVTPTDAAVIVGAGTSDKPNFTRNGDVVGFSLDIANGCYLLNIKVGDDNTTTANDMVAMGATGVVVQGCDFVCTEKTTGAAVKATPLGENSICDSCTFTSSPASNATVPDAAFVVGGCGGVVLSNSTFDGSAHGWVAAAAASIDGNDLVAENISLLRGSVMVVDLYNNTAEVFIQIGTATGGSGIVSKALSE